MITLGAAEGIIDRLALPGFTAAAAAKQPLPIPPRKSVLKRFLLGALANTVIVLLGYIAITALAQPTGASGRYLFQTQVFESVLIGFLAAGAAFLHVRLTHSAAIGPVLAVLGACAVTTVVNAALSGSALPQTADSTLTLITVVTAATGALIGGSLGVLVRR